MCAKVTTKSLDAPYAGSAAARARLSFARTVGELRETIPALRDDRDTPEEMSASPEANAVLTKAELQHVLSRPSEFGFQEMIWYAVNAPQPLIDTIPEYTLAGRLGSTATHLDGIVQEWLTAAGRPVLLQKASAVAGELNSLRRETSHRLVLSSGSSRRWINQGSGAADRQRENVRWLMFGALDAEETATTRLDDLLQRRHLERELAGARAAAQAEGSSLQASTRSTLEGAESAYKHAPAPLLVSALPVDCTLRELARFRLEHANAPAQAETAAAAAQAAALEAASTAEAAAAADSRASAVNRSCRSKASSSDTPGTQRADRSQGREAAQAEAEAQQSRQAASDAAERARIAQDDHAATERRRQEEKEAVLAERARQATGMAALAARKAAEEAMARTRARAAERRSVGEIFAALLPEGTRPVSASGVLVPEYLLKSKFCESYEACNVSQKRRLLASAAALIHAVLLQLAPDPLLTAQRVVERRVSNAAHPDPLRLRLSEVAVAPPKGKRLLELIASSAMAQSLIQSYNAAVARKAKMAEKAQILSPLTATYSLRMFNECFNLNLNRYSWRYARWHAHIWLAAQTPMASQTQRWRLKGSGEFGTLPHALISDALDYLTSASNLQHVAFGVRRVSTGSGWVEFSSTQRTECAEALWRAYVQSRTSTVEPPPEQQQQQSPPPPPPPSPPPPPPPPPQSRSTHLSRSHFLELANMVAGSTQRSYGALDTFAEQNGRQQFQALRGHCEEVRTLVGQLLQASLLPPGSQSKRDRAAASAAVVSHADQLAAKLDIVERHIKRGLAKHVPSCGDAEPLITEATCPEHCRACAFGTASGDRSRSAPCTRKHTRRCVECATAHSLEPDFQLLMKRAATLLEAFEADALGGAGGDDGGGGNGGGAGGGGGGAAGGGDGGGDAAGSAAASTSGAGSSDSAGGAGAADAGGSSSREREARVSFKELRLAIARALQRVKAYHTHERRAAHEAEVLEKLLRDLDDTGCILIADWKQKFLSASFREAMSDYFGKAGMHCI